jgi:nucleoside triphosphate pyrophosphatase
MNFTTGLWHAAEPLVLASASAVRRKLLQQAGIAVEVQPARIDERAIEAGMKDRDARQVALALAEAKARSVALELPGRLVLGCDQTLALGARLFVKPADRAEARAQLLDLRAKTHALTSAFALVRDGTMLAHDADTALLTMREFSDGFLEAYLDAMGAAATASVGAYQLEGLGIHLFERVQGDTTTVLGLPLLAVVAVLRRLGCLVD